MAANSVAQIGFDLVVNQNGFKKQMARIQSLAKKAGAVLAAAFAVSKITDFAAQCIELGSDLQEVQNVVDVTFPNMSRQINQFAKDAAISFGLSETMAKRFTGTFGAMSKAFGFSEQAAYEMATTLTGLAGDVASFYNISQDEAYTKLKSVFTGETESLKDLGVVMTQTALDQYALANGYSKTTKAMTEAEKVALRYKFVQDQLSSASGDFIRTSDSWANQVRVLKLQFDSLKATIGQGLINVLTPVIKVINAIIGKLMSLANAFKAFTELITGGKSSREGIASAASGVKEITSSVDQASTAMGGAGKAAKKAASDIKGITTGIDELNIINPESGSGSEGGSSGSSYQVDDFDMGELDTSPVDALDRRYQSLIDKAKELKNLFQTGFSSGFGDLKVFDTVQSSIQSIGSSLKEIFTDPEVKAAANEFANELALNLGKVAGGFTSVGMSLADNFLGGLEEYLSQNTERIRDYILALFDLGTRSSQLAGNVATAFSVVFSVFQSDEAKKLTADLVGIFSEAFMGVTELVGTFALDVLETISAPFTENAGLIQTSLENTFAAVEPFFSSVKDLLTETFTKIKETYDQHITPTLLAFKKGFTEIAEKFLQLYNAYFVPVIEALSTRFVQFKDQYLSPLIDKFLEFSGKVADAITQLWESVLQPFVLWFMENIAPVIAQQLQTAIDVFFFFAEVVASVVTAALESLSGLIDFLVGVFTGDWEKAWSGIQTYFDSVWNMIRSIVSSAIQFVANILGINLDKIKAKWDIIWGAVRDFFQNSFSVIHAFASEKIESVKAVISDNLDVIQKTWNDIWTKLKNKVSEVWTGIEGIIKVSVNAVITGVEGLINRVIDAVNWLVRQVNKISIDVPDTPFGEGFTIGFDIPSLDNINLPKLAGGGFVEANTPRLAMIGDNSHYGEIVAPENKMQEMVDRAVAMASGNGLSEQYLSTMIDLLKRIIQLIESMDLTVTIDIRELKKKLTDLERRSGYSMRTT